MDNYWYARDKDGQLFAYREEPHKLSESWGNDDFDCEWDEVVPDIGYDYIRWEDESPVLNAEPIVQAPGNLRSLFKLHYLEKKDMFIATIPVYTNKDAITGVQKQLEELLGSKVVVINGEFEYIKELHNLSS